MVRCRIVEGDTGGNFTIDSVTGEVRPTGTLDYELIPGTTGVDKVGRGGGCREDTIQVYNMTVRAFDLGSPSLWTDVAVRVFILDQNDHAPKVGIIC